MLIQNASRRSYVIRVKGEEVSVEPNQTLDVDKEVADDLLSNYPTTEWRALEVFSYKEKEKEEKEEKPLPKETKSGKSKGKR